MSNSARESPKGLKPHSYMLNFSKSSSFEDKIKDKKNITVDKTTLNKKNKKMEK